MSRANEGLKLTLFTPFINPFLDFESIKPSMVKCPVCGYDTLTEEGGFEICYICRWEDKPLGRITPPDKVIGGANGNYSMNEARENFQKYLIMYRPGSSGFFLHNDEYIINVKKEIIQAFEKLKAQVSNEERKKLKEMISKNAKRIEKYLREKY